MDEFPGDVSPAEFFARQRLTRFAFLEIIEEKDLKMDGADAHLVIFEVKEQKVKECTIVNGTMFYTIYCEAPKHDFDKVLSDFDAFLSGFSFIDKEVKPTPFRIEDYYAFGRPVLAPADGKVVKVVSKMEDNIPPKMEPNAGNYVIIDHGHSEFSCFAHFKKDSITVKVGQEVRQGEVIGYCGNSGFSSGPHIHYHLQDNGVFFAGVC
ncbi:TPA: M23 family metallopeptidase [Candidatus Poribacteria bacterium]|nr:M23 family metallopeptidase [Candidatus Poribacteria bacterium]